MLVDTCQVGGICSSRTKAFLSVAFGLWGGCAIGFITEYYTSYLHGGHLNITFTYGLTRVRYYTSFSYQPVREVANACRTGAATNIIYGLALGYKSAVIPVCILAFIVHGGHFSMRYAGVHFIRMA